MIRESTKLVEFLRLLADFYEQHPDVELPIDLKFEEINVYLHDNAKSVLASIGSFEKGAEDNYFLAKKQLGSYSLVFKAPRNEVCVPRVVGKRVIPAHTIPAEYKEETFVPEREEEIIEWDCRPVLAQRAETA